MSGLVFKLVEMAREVEERLLQKLSSDRGRRGRTAAAIWRVSLTHRRHSSLEPRYVVGNAVHTLL